MLPVSCRQPGAWYTRCEEAVSSYWSASWGVALKYAPNQCLTHGFQLMTWGSSNGRLPLYALPTSRNLEYTNLVRQSDYSTPPLLWSNQQKNLKPNWSVTTTGHKLPVPTPGRLSQDVTGIFRRGKWDQPCYSPDDGEVFILTWLIAPSPTHIVINQMPQLRDDCMNTELSPHTAQGSH